MQHMRAGEIPMNIEEFKRQEALQWQPQQGITSKVQMNISYVKKHATHELINNEKDLDQFYQKARHLIVDLVI
jgi:lipopolysaccharide/colanic/teichoic acid biosynthesis glycosyltransferase